MKTASDRLHDEITRLREELSILNERLESRPCPHIVTDDEGTSYCELAELKQDFADVPKLCRRYERRIAELKKAIEYSMRYCDRETFNVLEEALKGE